MEGFIYILKSNKIGKFYIGSTNNLKRRISQHQNGKVGSTKYLLPLDLVFTQGFKTLQEARKIEFKLKKLKRRDIIQRVINDGVIVMRA